MKSVRTEEFLKDAICVGTGYITEDGQYWLKSNCSSDRTGVWFDAVGVPEEMWAKVWRERAIYDIMNS